jgi:uncharacterized integral membrane protein
MEVKASDRLGQARSASQAQHFDSSIIFYFQAINWYSPIGSSQTAAQELFNLANQLKMDGNHELSYLAFLRLRSALNATRSFYFPHKDLIEQSNYEIASYLASKQLANIEDTAEKNQLTQHYFEIYQNSPQPNEGWYFAIVLGFLLWVISMVRCIFIYFNGERNPLKSKFLQARIPITLFIFGYALWLFAMGVA